MQRVLVKEQEKNEGTDTSYRKEVASPGGGVSNAMLRRVNHHEGARPS